MKKLFVAALIAGSFISFEARAQERAGDAALGAVSGAVVLGPVGAVAGALIGYTAGPAIAHSWGVRRPAPRPRVRRATQSGVEPRQPGTQETKSQETRIQETRTKELAAQEQVAAKVSSAPSVRISETVGKAASPVQGFE